MSLPPPYPSTPPTTMIAVASSEHTPLLGFDMVQTRQTGSSSKSAVRADVIGELRPPTPPVSAGRQVTPSKVSRSTTPEVRSGSAARSGSASRSASLTQTTRPVARSSSAQKHRNNLAQASFDAQHSQRARSVQTGARRLWRYERAHPALLRGPYGDADDEDIFADFEEAITASPKVDWRSLFSRLFQAQHYSHMETFRGCAESRADAVHRTNRCLRQGQWADAEVAWLKVEKRLRGSVLEALSLRPEMLQFVQALEACLMFFAEKLDVPPPRLLPPALTRVLGQPLEVVREMRNKASTSKDKRKSGRKRLHSTDRVVKADSEAAAPSPVCHSIRLNLSAAGGDSAFYRLFVHTTSQFYGFKSASVNASCGDRVTTITAPSKITSSRSPMIRDGVSLAGFLENELSEQQSNGQD